MATVVVATSVVSSGNSISRLDDAEASTGWNNIGGGQSGAAEAPFAYQASNLFNRKVTSSTGAGFYYDPTGDSGSGVDMRLGIGQHTTWIFKGIVSDWGGLQTTDGFVVRLGDSTSLYNGYVVAGSDSPLASLSQYPPRGGLIVLAVGANTNHYRDANESTSTYPSLDSTDYFGIIAKFASSTAKSENVGCDAIDLVELGGGFRLTRGDSTDTDGVWQDFVDHDEGTTSNRYGLCRNAEGGAILMLGTHIIGESATATEFTDSEAIVTWLDHMAPPGFNTASFDLGNASTSITDGATHISAGNAVNADSRADYIVTGTSGSLTRTGSMFNFRNIELTSGCTVNDNAFIQCEKLTQGTADIEGGSLLETTSDATFGTVVDPTFGTATDLNNMNFVQGGSGHAMQVDDLLNGEAGTLPSWQTPGSVTTHTGSAGSETISPAWPTHQVDDIGLLVVHSTVMLGGPPILTANASDWNYIGFGVGYHAGASNHRHLHLFWSRATSTSMGTPTIRGTGNAQILLYRNCIPSGVPYRDVSFNGSTASGTTATWNAVTTELDNERVVGIAVSSATASFMSGITNGGLVSITERADHNGTFPIAVWDAFDNVSGSTGNTTATVTNSWWATCHLVLQGSGAPNTAKGVWDDQSAGSGSGDVTVNLPTHSTDDVFLMYVETYYNETPTLSTPAGFVQAATVGTADTGGNGTRLTLFWHRAASASESDPTIADPGDHCIVSLHSYRGCRKTGNPWDALTTGFSDSASTSYNIQSVSTLFQDQVVILGASTGLPVTSGGAWVTSTVNSNLTSITERADGSNDFYGNGGGIAVIDAVGPSTAGAIGTTALTCATSSPHASIALALAADESTKTLTNIGFEGYGANGTDSAAIRIRDVSGQYVFNISGGDTPTITSDGAGWRTQNTVNVTLNNLIVGSECLIYETADPSNVIMALTADTTTETVSYNYISDLAITVRVRKASADPQYLPYEATGTITSSGFSLNVAQIEDLIFED